MSWIKQFGPRAIPLLPHSVGTMAYIYGTRRLMGYPLQNRLILFNKGSSTAYEWSQDIEKINKLLLKRAQNNPQTIWLIIKRYNKIINSFKKFTESIQRKNLEKIDNLGLLKIIKIYLQKLYQCNYGPMARRIDETITPLVTDYLQTIVKDAEKLSEYIRILLISPVETIIGEERREFLKIATVMLANKEIKHSVDRNKSSKEIIKKTFRSPKLYRLLKRHHRLFCWITVYWSMDKPLAEDYFARNLVQTLKHKTLSEIRKESKRISQAPQILKNKRSDLLKTLNLPRKVKQWADIVQNFSRIKSVHPDDLTFTQYNLLDFYQEIAKRASLSFQELKYLNIQEIIDFLESGQLPPRKTITNRQQYCLLLAKKGRMNIYAGTQARKMVKRELGKSKILFRANELRGFPASVGFVKGCVIVITSPDDLNKMNKGNILVVAQTNPNYLPAMRRASAIITDEGGITCHAAIVSRELNIPCVIGTKIATKTLKDGDLVEVDANRGVVKKLEK